MKNKSEILFQKLKPFLKHGSLILSSNKNNYIYSIIPSSIKHASFCYIDNEKYYNISMTEYGFKVQTFLSFLEIPNSFFIFEYYDLNIMKKSMNYIFNYKNYKYGFTGNRISCYDLIFHIYNNATGNNFQNKNSFIPSIKLFNYDILNSNSIINSSKFCLKVFIIENIFVTLK